jgi:DNA-binding NtrC family response regulator
MQAYAWPGNVRELRAEVARWVVFCDDRVELEDLSPEIQASLSTRGARGGKRGDIDLMPRLTGPRGAAVDGRCDHAARRTAPPFIRESKHPAAGASAPPPCASRRAR